MSLSIDIKFVHVDREFEFRANVDKGVPHVFEVGERILADRLFYILCGLDKNYQGNMQSDVIDFTPSKSNNVLAIGDRGMFVSGTVKKNIAKVLKVRHKDWKQKLGQVLENSTLQPNKKIKYLSDQELLQLSIMRAHFREVGLLVANCCETFIDYKHAKEICSPYIVMIT